MLGDELPNHNHVVRYVGASNMFDIDEGVVDGGAFILSDKDLIEDEPGLSVNWIEYFGLPTKPEQLEAVRRVVRRTLGANSRFAELEVGATKNFLNSWAPQVTFVHDPLGADDEHIADPSHTSIRGLGLLDTNTVEIIADLMAKLCVVCLHPGRQPV